MNRRVRAGLDRSVGRHVFGNDAVAYDSARLGYPAELYDRLFDRAGVPHRLSLFEIGPGTGIATRDLLARNPSTLVAVEPDPRMASYLVSGLATSTRRFRVKVASFEENGLEGGCFDVGIAAASFHWLDPDRSLAEVRRLLRPRGCWAMWWNVYRAQGIGDLFADEAGALVAKFPLPPSEGAAGHLSLDQDYQRKLLRRAGFVDVEYRLFRRERTLSAGQMRALYASYSFVLLLEENERERLLDAIAGLVECRFGGQAPNVVLTPLYLASMPETDPG